MNRLTVLLVGSAVLLASGCMRTARPAEVMLEARAAAAAGEHVGTLTGNGVRLMTGPIALGFSRSSAVSHPTDGPCGGFVLDSDLCGRQHVVQRDEIYLVSGGYVMSREHERTRFIGLPYVGVAVLEQDRVGIVSGAGDSGDGGAFALGTSAGALHNLFGGLWLGVLADAALIMPWNPGECADCSLPYEDWIGTVGIALTASWRLP